MTGTGASGPVDRAAVKVLSATVKVLPATVKVLQATGPTAFRADGLPSASDVPG
ncbi:hypothetical protein [Streptomyces sp. NPDC005281]|uniref:hypothetical protein n=1 Tax=Streptomyces sp. NPDC005281 TaxID=3155712 RepID=UPI0033AE7E2B